MRIFCWAVQKSGCSWYRAEMPFTQFTANGHDVTISYFYDGVPRDINEYDVVVGQILGTPIAADLWDILADRPRRPMMVYEIDDDFFSPVADDLKQYREPDAIDAVKNGLARADLVTTSTAHLAGVVAEHTSAPIEVLPNCIPAWLLGHERPRGNGVVIGWQGAQAHQGDWIGANLGVAGALRSKKVRAEFHTMGARCTTAPKADRHSEWKLPVEDYYRDIDFDIALAPLADTPFNRSKSHIRVLEAAALGIPVIASDVLPYRNFVRHGSTGALVRGPAEWTRYIADLAADPAERSRMGREARMRASSWTVEERWVDWLTAYEKVI